MTRLILGLIVTTDCFTGHCSTVTQWKTQQEQRGTHALHPPTPHPPVCRNVAAMLVKVHPARRERGGEGGLEG